MSISSAKLKKLPDAPGVYFFLGARPRKAYPYGSLSTKKSGKPVEKQLKDVYLNEKLGTKQGWSFPAPDENWMSGYPQELKDFIECLVREREPQSNLALAADTVSTLYAAYVSAQANGRETEIPLLKQA